MMQMQQTQSIRDILIALKCPKVRQLQVELALSVLGWSVDDLSESSYDPKTHAILSSVEYNFASQTNKFFRLLAREKPVELVKAAWK